MDKVNLREKFSHFSGHWQPKIVGELNGQHVKLVKFLGPFDWHHHDKEDELFLVRGEGPVPHGVPGSARLAGRGRVPDRPSWRRTPARRRGGGARPAVRAGLDAQHGQRPE